MIEQILGSVPVPAGVREYMGRIGRAGGAAGRGPAKRRGNRAYYRRIASLAVAARRVKAEKKDETAK